jgi:hypothetical protein
VIAINIEECMHIGFAFYGLFHNVGFLPVSLFLLRSCNGETALLLQ